MSTAVELSARPRLTEVCWPVFDFVINFARQARDGITSAPAQVRYKALAALRDAEDLARGDPATERAWDEHVKRMLIYLIDYKMLTTDWPGRSDWLESQLEIDPQILDEPEALGGQRFFQDCDQAQREYEQAERRDRRDKDELAERLALYFICLRLGFRGQFDDRPQELADYTKRLFMRLPACAATRGKELFPEAYRHNQEVKIDYRLGMRLTLVLAVLGAVLVTAGVTFQFAWKAQTKAIADAVDCISQAKPGAESAAPGS